MYQKECYNFGYVPMVAEWRSYKNTDKTNEFHELCFGDMKIAMFYIDPSVEGNNPKFKVEGIANNIKRQVGYYPTREEAENVCYCIAKHIVNKIRAEKKILTFIE